jgi:hypothetical protein
MLEMFGRLCHPHFDEDLKEKGLTFLNKLIHFAGSLVPFEKDKFFKAMDANGFFDAIEANCVSDNESTRKIAVETLSVAMDVSCSAVRRFMVRQAQTRDMVS